MSLESKYQGYLIITQIACGNTCILVNNVLYCGKEKSINFSFKEYTKKQGVMERQKYISFVEQNAGYVLTRFTKQAE